MARLIWHGSKGMMNLGRNASKQNKLAKKESKKTRVALLKAQADMVGVKRFELA